MDKILGLFVRNQQKLYVYYLVIQGVSQKVKAKILKSREIRILNFL